MHFNDRTAPKLPVTDIISPTVRRSAKNCFKARFKVTVTVREGQYRLSFSVNIILSVASELVIELLWVTPVRSDDNVNC